VPHHRAPSRASQYCVTMLPANEPPLSRSEWIVLSLVCEGPTHGLAVTRLVGPDGDLGRIWHVPKGVVYRSLDQLADLGLIRSAGEQRSDRGPARLLVEPTETGRGAAVSWQQQPVQHTRDVRSELLVKLALLDRSGTDSHDLLTAQHALLVPIAEALRNRIATAAGFDRTLMLWRYETATATIRFLDSSLATPVRGTAP
jgi:DNA-binding PadR family transcriptional regulator